MENYYVLEITGKNFYNFLKYLNRLGIDVINIRYFKNRINITVNYKDYLNILKIKTAYKIKLIDVKGIKKINFIFIHNKLFLPFFALSILVIILFSSIIFKINYIDVPSDLRLIIKEELDNNKITKYSFKKSYKSIQKIKSSIKNKHKDLIEWIEIEEKGMTYNIKVIKRVKNELDKEKSPSNIVASKNGFIISILASSGEVLKNPGDYVHKGDVIVSGIIKNNDKIVGIKNSQADIYAETWYKVKISHPFTYYQDDISKDYKKFYYLEILGKRINIYRKNNKYKLLGEKIIFDNNIIKLVREKKSLSNKKEIKYNEEELEKLIENIAREKIKETIGIKDEILLQKTLKKSVGNDKMNIEIFFKIKENIKEERKIDLEKEKYD